MSRPPVFLMVALALAASAAGCSEERADKPAASQRVATDEAAKQAPKKASDEAAAKKAAEAKAAEEAAAKKAAEAKAAEAKAAEAKAAEAKAAEEAAAKKAAEEAAKKYSVALHFTQGRDQAFKLPEAGKKNHIRVTIIDGKGQPVGEREQVMGGELVMIMMRADAGWFDVQRAVELDDPGKATHTFHADFPQGGNHVFYFMFKPKDAPIQRLPTFLKVGGKGKPGERLEPKRLRWAGERGLARGVEAALLLSEEDPIVCEPLDMSTIWIKRGKPVRLDADGSSGVTTWYFTVDAQPGHVLVGKPRTVPPAAPLAADAAGGAGDADDADDADDTDDADRAAAKQTAAAEPTDRTAMGDRGTHATLTPDRVGAYRLVAVAWVGGKPLVASFAFTASGEMPEGGCAALAAKKPAATP